MRWWEPHERWGSYVDVKAGGFDLESGPGHKGSHAGCLESL